MDNKEFIEKLTFLKKHFPNVNYWSQDIDVLRQAILDMCDKMAAIHAGSVWSNTATVRSEYWETGNYDDAYGEGKRFSDSEVMSVFGCGCADEDD